jgi:hypothetical protein
MLMNRTVMLLLLAIAQTTSAQQRPLEFDHIWIAVSPNAAERRALERAGFHISPDVNRHDGQGTASITVEFENAFVELIWVDRGVPVTPELQRVTEKFRQRSAWRTSGWSPFGIGLRRTGSGNTALPVPTWPVTAAWLPRGSAIEMLTPRDDTTSPSMFISPAALSDPMQQAARFARFGHSNGVHRITGVRLLTPAAYQPISALQFLETANVLSVATAAEWTVELTFDSGAQHKQRDLRPDLPLVIHY